MVGERDDVGGGNGNHDHRPRPEASEPHAHPVHPGPHEKLALRSRGWTRAHTLHADAMARSGGDGGGCQTKRSRSIAEIRESAPQLIPGHLWGSSRHLLAQTTLNVQVQGRGAWVRGIVGVLGESIADDGCEDRVRKGTRRCCHQTEKSEKRRRDRALLARCSRSLQVTRASNQ